MRPWAMTVGVSKGLIGDGTSGDAMELAPGFDGPKLGSLTSAAAFVAAVEKAISELSATPN